MEIIRRDQVTVLSRSGLTSHQLLFPDVHGFSNTGTVPFEYLAVTAPPINFRDAYAAPDSAGQR